MSQIIKAFSELGCSSRSKINNRTLVPATLNNDKIELDQDTFPNRYTLRGPLGHPLQLNPKY